MPAEVEGEMIMPESTQLETLMPRHVHNKVPLSVALSKYTRDSGIGSPVFRFWGGFPRRFPIPDWPGIGKQGLREFPFPDSAGTGNRATAR